MYSLNGIKHIHMIGIGGVGVSAIADILIDKGIKITGSDIRSSDITDRLSKKGATVFFDHRSDNIAGADLIVYTSAANISNPELIAAKEKNIKILSRAEMLGHLMKNYEKSIAVSGVHGKTTTTSMISLAYKNCNQDPTFLIGGDVAGLGGNARSGNGNTFITEACEYRDSFLEFHPTDLLILNIDDDHKDYFESLEQLISSFSKFSKNIQKDGTVYANADDSNVFKLLGTLDLEKCNLVTFGLSDLATYRASNLSFNSTGMPCFDVICRGDKIASVKMSIPGTHNVLNAMAAFSVCHSNSLPADDIAASLSEFKGAKRRFDVVGEYNGATVIDDYAHHPTEVMATLSAASNMPFKRVITVFQPHTYTRTRELLEQFSSSFEKSDLVIVTDIYAAREPDPGNIHSRDLVERLSAKDSKSIYLGNFDDIEAFLKKEVTKGDLVFTMGAGDVYKIGYSLTKK